MHLRGLAVDLGAQCQEDGAWHFDLAVEPALDGGVVDIEQSLDVGRAEFLQQFKGF
jgi:hypothetical protein